jgi:hypothetical protein
LSNQNCFGWRCNRRCRAGQGQEQPIRAQSGHVVGQRVGAARAQRGVQRLELVE